MQDLEDLFAVMTVISFCYQVGESGPVFGQRIDPDLVGVELGAVRSVGKKETLGCLGALGREPSVVAVTAFGGCPCVDSDAVDPW